MTFPFGLHPDPVRRTRRGAEDPALRRARRRDGVRRTPPAAGLWRRRGHPANRGDEVVAAEAGVKLDAGLDRPTRFVGARRMVAPLGHAGLATGRGRPGPTIGWLTGHACQRLAVVRGLIVANAALATQFARR
jgi:hypothetical protein